MFNISHPKLVVCYILIVYLFVSVPINCTQGQIKCPNTNVCLLRRHLCDGDNDCGDGADEESVFCEQHPCGKGEFAHHDTQLIETISRLF